MTKLNDWFISISPASKQIEECVSESEEYDSESNRGFSIDFPDGSGEDYNNRAVDDTGVEYGGGDDSFISGCGIGCGDGDGDGNSKGNGTGLESALRSGNRYEDFI